MHALGRILSVKGSSTAEFVNNETTISGTRSASSSFHLEMIVNRNQDKGVGKQVKGKIKEVVGKVTDDKFLEGEGKVEKGIGKVQKNVGDAQQPRPPRNDRL
jgi:uncharacterized protein YjbJ (UPF0337 family)